MSAKPGKATHLNFFGQIAVDDSHHVITGSIAYLRGKYTVQLTLTSANRQVIARGSASCTNPEELYQTAMIAAQKIGESGSASIPLIDVITRFELDERGRNTSLVICPEMIFLDVENPYLFKPVERKKNSA